MVVRQSQVKVLNLRILHLIETFQLPHITWVFTRLVHKKPFFGISKIAGQIYVTF